MVACLVSIVAEVILLQQLVFSRLHSACPGIEHCTRVVVSIHVLVPSLLHICSGTTT